MPRLRGAWKYCDGLDYLLLRGLVVEQAGDAQLDELLERQIAEAVTAACAMNSSSMLKMRALTRSSAVTLGNFCLSCRAYSGVTPWTRMASNCLESRFANPAAFMPADELGRDLEDAEGDCIMDVIDLQSLLLHLDDGLGCYSLNLAGDEIVGGEFSEACLVHRLGVLRSDVLNLHGNQLVEVDVVAGGFHLVDVVTVGTCGGRSLVVGLRFGCWRSLRRCCLWGRSRRWLGDMDGDFSGDSRSHCGCSNWSDDDCGSGNGSGLGLRVGVEAGQQVRHGKKDDDESGAGGGKREGAETTAGNASHGFTEDACNTREKSCVRLMAVERHGEAQVTGAVLFEMNESVRVNDGVGADFEGEIVAAEFALVANAGADPPDGGMEEEERFGDGLQDVPEEVGAAHVSEFVGENDFEFVSAE